MPDYKQGKIYCLRSHQTDDIYIGSTIQSLSMRLVGHKRNFKCWKNGKNKYISSFELIKYDDCYIELLEECPCENKNQLLKREGQLIRELDCVNKIVSGRTIKEYREENKEQIKEGKKKYREENKEQIAEYNKKYNQENKEKRTEWEKKRYEAEKNDFKCEVCNYIAGKSNYKKHLKTQKHIKNSS